MDFAQRLKAARSHAQLTQGQLAERSGIDQSVISKLERGKHAGSVHTVRLARFTGVRPEWLGEELGPMLANGVPVNDGMQEDEYAFIPVLSIKAAAGDGYENVQEVNEGTLAFKREWMHRQGLREDHLRLIRACGDSMAPSISDGDMLLVDTSRIEPVSGNVYAIRRPDYSLSVKRLEQGFTGEWTIKSDNSDKAKYGDELVGDITAANIPIVGKVVWRGGMM